MRAASETTDRLVRRLDANRRGDYADPLRVEAAYNAILSLQRSDRADKAVTIVSLIDRGDLDAAAEMLQRIYEEQTAAGLSASARIETLSQITAVVFHQDTTKAIARNLEILKLAEGSALVNGERILLAHYALAMLYHRVNDPDRANEHFAAMTALSPDDDEVRIWAELGFLNSWLMKPKNELADFDEIEARLLALQPSLAADQNQHATAEFWTTYASLDYFRGSLSDDAAVKQAAIRKQLRAVEVEQEIAGAEKLSAGLARAYMRLGALQIDRPDRGAGVQALEKALSISRAAQDRQTEGSALLNLAYAMNDGASFDRAAAYAQEALKLAQEEHRPNLKALSRHLLADIVVASKGDEAEACKLFAAAITDYASTPLSASGVAASARESARALECDESV
jgi:tetratricopeptide (TPR) repeat protein